MGNTVDSFFNDRPKCACTDSGYPCPDPALEGHSFCANCLDDGECPCAESNSAVERFAEKLCPCGCGSPDDFSDLGDELNDDEVEQGIEDIVLSAKTLMEVQLVALVRKHEQIDSIIGILDDTPGSNERKAAGHLLDALSPLDDAIFDVLYQWAKLQD